MHALFTISVKAAIRTNNEVLLLIKQQDHKLWDMPGGRVEPGESFEENLLREISEELPSAKNPKILRQLYTWQTPIIHETGNGYLMTFFEVTAEIDKVVYSKEHIGYKWINKQNLEDLIKDKSIYLADGFEKVLRILLN